MGGVAQSRPPRAQLSVLYTGHEHAGLVVQDKQEKTRLDQERDAFGQQAHQQDADQVPEEEAVLKDRGEEVAVEAVDGHEEPLGDVAAAHAAEVERGDDQPADHRRHRRERLEQHRAAVEERVADEEVVCVLARRFVRSVVRDYVVGEEQKHQYLEKKSVHWGLRSGDRKCRSKRTAAKQSGRGGNFSSGNKVICDMKIGSQCKL